MPFIKQPASPRRKRKARNQQEAGRERQLRGELLPHRAVSAPQLLAPLGLQQGSTGTAPAPQGAPKPPL